MAAALLLLVLLFLGERCGSYGNFQGELDACLGPLLSGRGVTPAPVWRTQGRLKRRNAVGGAVGEVTYEVKDTW